MRITRPKSGFTLIELLVSISIIAMLVTLFAPQLGNIQRRAESVKCANNLRVIGNAVQLYAAEHNNRFPTIEAYPSNPVYGEDDEAGTLLGTLGPYGVSEAVVKCETDVRLDNYFQKEGSSYMWRPIVDDEITSAPTIYHPRRGEITPRAIWLRICGDYRGVHNGRSNRLYADGHVRSF